MVVVGSYTLVKGEISEKLAVRLSRISRAPSTRSHAESPQQLPRGLDDPRWDFSPKEEAERIPIHGAATPSAASSASGGKSCAGSSRS